MAGTGGAVKFAMKNQDLGDEFFVLNGDCYFALDHREMLKAHKSFSGIATIALSPQIQIERFGSVDIDNNFRICKFCEKAKTNRSGLINGGVYIFSRDILRHFPSKRSFSLEYEVFPNAIMDGLYGFVSKEYFLDIGVPDDFRRAQKDFPPYE
jgi:D-glycero-alpha-D-manno-heptose 1-phosphate guanylyltransferase